MTRLADAAIDAGRHRAPRGPDRRLRRQARRRSGSQPMDERFARWRRSTRRAGRRRAERRSAWTTAFDLASARESWTRGLPGGWHRPDQVRRLALVAPRPARRPRDERRRPVLAYFRGDDGCDDGRGASTRSPRRLGAEPARRPIAGARPAPRPTPPRSASGSRRRPCSAAARSRSSSNPAPLLRSKADREALDPAIRTVAPGNALVFLEQGDGGDEAVRGAPGPRGRRAQGGRRREGLKAPRGRSWPAGSRAGADEREITLGPGAAKDLAQRIGGFVREGDVDRQRQGALAVGRAREARALPAFDPVGRGRRSGARRRGVPDSTWAFLDAVAERKAAVAGPLLDRLLETTPEPVVSSSCTGGSASSSRSPTTSRRAPPPAAWCGRWG